MNPNLDFQGFYSHFQTTSGQMTSLLGHFRSRGSYVVISCHVTATCELQPCGSSNVPKTGLTGFLQSLPGDFRSNDVTSGSLPVTWVACGHFLSHDYLLLRVTAL